MAGPLCMAVHLCMVVHLGMAEQVQFITKITVFHFDVLKSGFHPKPLGALSKIPFFISCSHSNCLAR
jgi:hypothetical protein